MAYSLNKVQLIGNLGRDAEVTQAGGSNVTKFNVATESSYRPKDSTEWVKTTTWHNCVLWNRENLAPKMTKGSKIFVDGRIQNRSYDDKDGKKVNITEIVVDEVILLGSGYQAAANGADGEGGNFEPPF